MATKVAYLCDQKLCEFCSYPECKHTFDISHAKNLEDPDEFPLLNFVVHFIMDDVFLEEVEVTKIESK